MFLAFGHVVYACICVCVWLVSVKTFWLEVICVCRMGSERKTVAEEREEGGVRHRQRRKGGRERRKGE